MQGSCHTVRTRLRTFQEVLPEAYYRDGSIYAMKAELSMKSNTLFCTDVRAVLNNISGGIRDSIAERKKYLKERHKDFVSRSKKIIKVAELLSFDYEKMAQEIESGKHDITIMIESSPINAVKRAVKEAIGALENPIDNI